MGDAPIAFAEWVRRGVVGLARALPWAAARMDAALGDRLVELSAEGESAWVTARSGVTRVFVAPPDGRRPAVTLHTSRRAIVALADGDDTLLDAVLSGRVVLRGDVADLVAVHDALMAFLQGAVRAPDFVETLVAFRAWQRARDAHSPPEGALQRHG